LSGLAQPLDSFQEISEVRISTALNELNRVLGGGLVPGSVVLLGGEPGIGKSTLALQAILSNELRSLYISGEESAPQIISRAKRLNKPTEGAMVLTDTTLSKICATVQELTPDVVVIDSIQTIGDENIDAAQGTVIQIRACTAKLIWWARQLQTPFILIGHVNKEGDLAGPKLLEHMVDVVLHFEGDRHYYYRMLRATKNRFGNTQEMGIFEMNSQGLQEVLDPALLFLSESAGSQSGSALGVVCEGTRAMVIEIQALVSSSVFGMPQRVSSGFDTRRLNMLLAVLEKRCGFRFSQKDVFLNVTGGIRLDDPGADLAVVTAILSSYLNIPVGKKSLFSGEIGLTGEIRPVQKIELRISEALRLGFLDFYMSSSYKKLDNSTAREMRILGIERVQQLLNQVFSSSENENPVCEK